MFTGRIYASRVKAKTATLTQELDLSLNRIKRVNNSKCLGEV